MGLGEAPGSPLLGAREDCAQVVCKPHIFYKKASGVTEATLGEQVSERAAPAALGAGGGGGARRGAAEQPVSAPVASSTSPSSPRFQL